jgi:predicted PurR-regulated permease PerM
MKSETFQRGFLLLLVVFISSLFFWMIRSFLMTLLLAAIFSSLARPLYLRFTALTKNRKNLSSGLTLLVFVLIIILPLFGFLGIVASQAVKVTENARPWIQEKISNKDQLNDSLHKLPGFKYLTPYSEQIMEKVGGAVSGLGNFFIARASALTAGTLVFFLNFGIMLYAMFFFLIDGPAVLNRIFYYIPLQHKDEKRLVSGFRSMARATIKGLVIIGIVQGTLAGLALWAAGVPSALFWGTVMAVLSMIPNIGSALVWAPASIYLFIKGDMVAGGLVFAWCALVVGSVDNILRPILVGKDTQVPELLVLVSTLGGLTLWGLEGFILGPVLALLFLTIWDIYGVTFKDSLPHVGDFPPA